MIAVISHYLVDGRNMFIILGKTRTKVIKNKKIGFKSIYKHYNDTRNKPDRLSYTSKWPSINDYIGRNATPEPNRTERFLGDKIKNEIESSKNRFQSEQHFDNRSSRNIDIRSSRNTNLCEKCDRCANCGSEKK